MDLWFDSYTLDDPGRYRRLIGKLIYLTATKPDKTFIVGVLSKFIHQPREANWSVALRILAYIKSCPRKIWYIRNVDMYTFLNTLIQVILMTEKIESLLLDIVPLLEEIL